MSPGAPGHCLTGTVSNDAYAFLLDEDGQHVYWVDDSDGTLRRAPIGGGAELQLAALSGWIPLSMTVDDSNVYIGALPLAALASPMPGVILTIPKSGGTLAVLVSGVLTPFDVETDATHLYWAASGTFDIPDETIAPDGRIERSLKNGTGRQTLAENLSAPLDLALQEDGVYYGETGLAEGDETVGVYVVGKSGGAVTTIDDDTAAGYVTVAGDDVVVWGGDAQVQNALFVIRKDGGGKRTLVQDDFLGSGARVSDGVAYYLVEGEAANELWSVPVSGGTPARLRGDVYFTDDFEVDACAVTVGTESGRVERSRR